MLESTNITPPVPKTPGCASGSCGTGGCNKLNVFNWLTDMALPPGQRPFDVLEVRFKGSRKEFYRNKELMPLAEGDIVAVEASPGHDVGIVSMTGELVKLQLKKKHLSDTSDQIRTLYRKAKQNEIDKWNQVKAMESPTLHRARKIIDLLKLAMKLSDVEYQGDGKKATFYYTADDRVDFRELIKRLAEEFRVRIEMRQIGMRQEAGRLGGIGSCGRELCCSTWLTDFKSVTTGAARYQNLALNPAKLAGQCGKLKCCLNYELDSYIDALKDFPKTDITLTTEKGKASHRKTDIFKRMMWYAYDTGDAREQEMPDGGEGGNWIMLSVDRVKEIIGLNKEDKNPTDLRGARELEMIEVDDSPDYENVVGQDRIDRMDRKKKNKKKKRGGGGGQQQQAQGQGGGQRQQGQQGQQGLRPQGQQQGQRQQGQQQRQQSQGQRQQQQNRPQQQGQGQRPQQQQQNQRRQDNRPKQQNQGQQGQQRPPQQSGQQQSNRPPRQQPPKTTE